MSRPSRAAACAAALLLGVGACGPAARPAADAALAAPPPAVAAARADTLAPGVLHRFERRAEGPWAIHVVEVDPRACGVRLRTAAAHDGVVGLETTSSLAVRAGDGTPALVAVNADFFRAEPPGVPEGPQVAGGEVVAAEGSYGPSVSARFRVSQPVFGVARGAGPFVGEAALAGSAWTAAGRPHPLARVNAPPGPDSLALFNRFAGGAAAMDAGAVAVAVRLWAPAAAAGDTARAVVLRVDTLTAAVPVPEGGAVLVGRGGVAAWLRGMAPGDTVAWTLPFDGAPGPVEELVGGFPLLLVAGAPVLDRVPAIREAFAARRHPRTAVGLRPDGTVLLVVVDGRQPGHSDGMTLAELNDLLRGLGATEAVNLDGGGSTALVVEGRLVNRPSDPRERPVANALLVLGPAPGECPAD
jgi:hypothetical protein